MLVYPMDFKAALSLVLASTRTDIQVGAAGAIVSVAATGRARFLQVIHGCTQTTVCGRHCAPGVGLAIRGADKLAVGNKHMAVFFTHHKVEILC